MTRTLTLHHFALTALLGPLLLVQGMYVRRTTPKLPEPDGERCGVSGRGPPLRLLIAGDSAAAGVGALRQEEALAGQLVAALASHFSVHWRLHATTGWTTEDALQQLGGAEDQRYDFIVTSLGVNDVTANRPPRRWLGEQAQLIDMLVRKHAPRKILMTALPPMHTFPALPQPLRWYLGRAAARMNRLLQEWAGQRAECHFMVPFEGLRGPGYIASDGFHPGPAAYAAWGARLAETIRDLHS